MKYTVHWTPSAEQRLAKLWTDADKRSDITSAANTIDRALAETADTLGEAREGNVRVAFSQPLAVEFEVIADEAHPAEA